MHHFANPDHAQHDTTLIAGHAAGDLIATQASAASALLASCSDCTLLHRDLVAIAAATCALPRAARAPRDFRLDAEQAVRLRRGSWLRVLLRPFASAHSAARPMAAAFTSLGVAGLLVAAFVPGLIGGGAASAPTTEGRNALEAAGAPSPTAPGVDSVDPMFGGPQHPGSSEATDKSLDSASQAPILAAGGAGGGTGDNAGEETDGAHSISQASPPNLLVVGSLGFLLVGLLLFGLRMAARRVR
jgi:hypothetical protein